MGVISNDTPIEMNQGDAPAGGSVVLMRGRSGHRETLLRALSARGLAPVIAEDEPAAMVALAGLSEQGLARRVLVVVEPRQWPRVDELTAAARRYHGPVHCWQFVAAGESGPRLSPLACSPEQQACDGQDPGTVGKIHKRTRAVDRLLVPAPDQALSTREVVTQQELTMLLGPAPGEAG